ncbi:toll/interleukin-1 receptor domain-containing protein [Flavobacterium aquicola]|uniref:TIR domain-containing protein n=1 Tax=Flavobacterium aquicola TaxID=1682742 RepID=A0A3E0ET42_9FLAO|nr:toll/interleukin-1 receptor domain-containing protein [Flavobacterium aquicola]REH00831.1 TIR domain-containing protein [Flavobacterium aquicola]
MNIFISWSGESSKEIASTIKNWLPTVLQSTKPYFTPSDVEKGSKWESEITKKLNECKVGLICLTADNTEKPWILFESGALSNRLEKSRVCPILFGLSNSDLKGPLATFQTTEFRKDDFKKLIKSINKLLEENEIPDFVLDEAFEAFYPKLEQKINSILEDSNSDNQINKITKRSDRDILEEILELNRKQYITPKTIIEDNDDVYNLINSSNYKVLTFGEAQKLQAGDRVLHSKFGRGTVYSLNMYPEKPLDCKIDIKFDHSGIKKLLLRFAQLAKL